VPLAGKYRIVDIPISNCINSGLRQVYVLTQYNSASLNRHLVPHLPLRPVHTRLCRGARRPADARRRALVSGHGRRRAPKPALLPRRRHDYYLILSGDQLYRMDYRMLMRQHIATNADITIATIPVNAQDATAFGIMHSNENGRSTSSSRSPRTPRCSTRCASRRPL
jgi:glucose-1-phosphate adenylyltransferase